jgi:competence protein ComEA
MPLVSRSSIRIFAAALLSVAAAGAQELPDGPGKAETEKVCKGCHEVARSVSLRQDRDAWAITVQKMLSLGAKGTEKEIAAVLDYLVKHFPAQDVPRLKVNEATAIDFESRLSLKRSQAAALIRYRTEIGGFKSIEDLKKAPGIDPAAIEAAKDRLTF